jgi:3-hydroxyacyl-[acyl-carrier-protein] dehydratase
MVIKDLYRYRLTGKDENRIDAVLQINSQHPLYKGHFPGFPLTPGVCQLLMIREILEAELDLALMLSAARVIKFSAVHEPQSEPEIGASILFSSMDDGLEVTASLKRDEKVFLKLKGEFRKQK